MAKGQFLNHHQQKIVKRHYEHLDTIALNTLGELVSDLYLADSPKALEKLWKRAATALDKFPQHRVRCAQIMQSRDVEALAALTNSLTFEAKRR